jgi:hypothetical protein
MVPPDGGRDLAAVQREREARYWRPGHARRAPTQDKSAATLAREARRAKAKAAKRARKAQRRRAR